jgi:hypothetical protein
MAALIAHIVARPRDLLVKHVMMEADSIAAVVEGWNRPNGTEFCCGAWP